MDDKVDLDDFMDLLDNDVDSNELLAFLDDHGTGYDDNVDDNRHPAPFLCEQADNAKEADVTFCRTFQRR